MQDDVPDEAGAAVGGKPLGTGSGGGSGCLEFTPDHVRVVVRLAREVHLRREPVDAASDIEVDVRRPELVVLDGVGTGLHGYEAVATRPIGAEARETLEVRVERSGGVRIAGMGIAAGGVRLPNFDGSVRYRNAGWRENPPGHFIDP